MTQNDNSTESSELVPRLMFYLSLFLIVFGIGYSAHRFQFFPHDFIETALAGFNKVEATAKKRRPWFYRGVKPGAVRIKNDFPQKTFSGLTLTTSIGENNRMFIRIIDMDGEVVQEWPVVWKDIWPDATHIPEPFLPKEEPGTHIHGAQLMGDGAVVFNFEHLGLVRLNACGETEWRLPYRTHHSIYEGDDGNLWVSGQIDHSEASKDIPGYTGNFIEPTILKVSPEGEILVEKSVIQLLRENNLDSLLYMYESGGLELSVSGDTLHLNDIEVFPASLPQGYFKAGDVMISLRNIHAVLVFDRDWKIKHTSVGAFLRQHDPDFIDGNTFSIYDNNNLHTKGTPRGSRILIERVDPATGKSSTEEYFRGNKKKPFYSVMMGKHQWLPNGNLLITDSMNARAIEVDAQGDIVWEFINIIDSVSSGLLEEATRLPQTITPEFFVQARAACSAS